MQEIVLYSKCTQCNGTGEFVPGHIDGPNPIPCPWPGCNGTGYVEFGKVSLDPGLEDLMDKVEDVLDKCNDIMEKLNG